MASQSNAQLVVLPELVNSGYMFNNLDEVRERATTLDGAVIQDWVELAKDLRIIIVAGLALHVENKFLNASVVVDESGLRGWYAKAHLFGDEPKFFQKELRVFLEGLNAFLKRPKVFLKESKVFLEGPKFFQRIKEYSEKTKGATDISNVL